MTDEQKPNFINRGGLWILAQIPLLFFAYAIPKLTSGPGYTSSATFPHHIGAVIVVVGVTVLILGLMKLGPALTPFPRPQEQGVLQEHGIYRWMRHPIYSGLIVASLGWTLYWASLSGFVPTLALAVFFDRKAAREELWLEQKYSAYADYRRRVYKFWPGLY